MLKELQKRQTKMFRLLVETEEAVLMQHRLAAVHICPHFLKMTCSEMLENS